jgi:hypothetical protein
MFVTFLIATKWVFYISDLLDFHQYDNLYDIRWDRHPQVFLGDLQAATHPKLEVFPCLESAEGSITVYN